MRRIAPLFSILVIALVVSLAHAGVPSLPANDIARLYASSREAIVVVVNERNDTMEKIKKESEFRRSLRSSRRALSDLTMTEPLAYFFTANTFGETTVWSSGAGFFIREDGVVVTSYHIVKNSKNLFVILSSGERLAAEVIGFDSRPDYDIAVLKIPAKRTFPVLRLAAGNSFLKIGMPLLMIGHPYSFLYTANQAAISKLKLDASPRFIQVHSSVLPGNSGSPLIDSAGFVVGVVYAAMIDSGTQGFAVPAWMIREVLDRVLGRAN